MRRLTASRFGIALQCAHFLRDDVEWHDEKTTYIVTGNAAHKVNEEVVRGNIPDLVAISAGMTKRESETFARMSERYLEWVGEQDVSLWSTEVKLAWDPFSDKPIEIRATGARDYSELDGTLAVAGTADLTDEVWLAGDDLVACVDDLKTGFGGQTDPFPQGSMLTMMHAERLGAPRGRFRVIRIREDEPVTVQPFDFAPSDLVAVKAQIREVIRVALSDPEPREGPWCRYCPARPTCKAAQHAAGEALGMVPAERLTRGPKLAMRPLDDRHAAWTHTAIALARAVIDKAEEGLRAYADEKGGVPLPDGTVFKGWPVSTRRMTLDDAGVEILRAHGVDEKANTIAKVARAAGGHQAAEGLFKALEAAGTIRVDQSVKYEPRRPPREIGGEP